MISRDQRHNPASAGSFLILQAAGKFFDLFGLFDRRALPSQISCSSRAPVAQLDRASDYGLKTSDFHSFRGVCVSLAIEGKFRFRVSRFCARL
jgi:hypothetical protein